MILRSIRQSLQPPNPMPEELKQNFFHLVMDIGWFGVLNATTLAFLTVYATRIHARPEQIGLLNAIPAITSILLSLPSGVYLEKRSINKSAIVLGTLHRFFYLPLAFIPLLASESAQVNWILWVTLAMYIPYSTFILAFNSLFGSAVPIEWRGYFAGARNALFAIVTIIMALVSGFLLDRLAFPLGYQVVFGMGFVGAMMSTYHIGKLSLPPASAARVTAPEESREKISLRARILLRLRLDILRGPFMRVLLVLMAFHFTQYLPLPLFPLYYVNELKLADQTISIGTAIFYASMFIGSLNHSKLASRFGHRWALGVGMIVLGMYPGILSLAREAELYLIANLFSGFAWSLCGGALSNYLLENVPADSRPAYLAWFSLLANVGVLAGSLLGPMVSNAIGIVAALVLFAVLRAASGVAILRWG